MPQPDQPVGPTNGGNEHHKENRHTKVQESIASDKGGASGTSPWTNHKLDEDKSCGKMADFNQELSPRAGAKIDASKKEPNPS